jgi:hypothetical protein
LPIEKALTVKNEGTVSVSLTLSTAGPYKIVSVLPTLSPGQSAQVTLRFDPTESGTFTGAVQVGINGGQGSVTAPLVGTAHKIEIRPTVLDFGIVLVGSTKERKLTVKNQGVTTVTLEVPNTTQNTASPFRVMLESPLVLTPSESKEVLVQLSPTTSGEFTGTVRLMSGQAVLEIPAKAKAYTEEEYRQMLKQSILATCQATEESQGLRNIFFVPGYNRDYLFYRMPCPTDEELDALLELLMEPENQPPLDDILLEQFGDPENIIAALNELFRLFNLLLNSLRGNPNATQDDINRILQSFVRGDIDYLIQNYPGFREFYTALVQASPNLGGVIISLAGLIASIPGVPLPPVSGAIISIIGLAYSVLTMKQPIGLSQQEWQARQFVFLMMVIMAEYPNSQAAIQAVIRSNVHGGMSGADSRMKALLVIVAAGIAAQVPAAQEVGLNSGFYNKFLGFVATAYGPNSRVNSGQLQNYMNYLVRFGEIPVNLDKYANSIGGFIAFVGLAQDGWNIVGHIGSFGHPHPEVHVIATQVIAGREVAVFIHVEAKLGVNEVEKVANIIENITSIARRSYSSEIGTAAERVTVLLVFSAEPGAVAQLEQALQAKNLQTPVLILYPENGQWQARCVGNCSDKDFLDAVAAALAQALGTPYSGGSENALGEMLSKLEEAMELAQLAFLGMSPDKAWWLTYGICGADLGCILNIAEYLKRELEEQCGGPCPVPTMYPRALPSRKQGEP